MDPTLQVRAEAVSDNADIEQHARALLDAHSHFRGRGRQFEFLYREDVLVVRGLVPTFYLKQVLQTALKDLDGIRSVENQVTVVSRGGFDDMRGRAAGPVA